MDYVQNVSFALDLKIIFKSLKVIVVKENALNASGYVSREIEDLKVSNGNFEVDFK